MDLDGRLVCVYCHAVEPSEVSGVTAEVDNAPAVGNSAPPTVVSGFPAADDSRWLDMSVFE